MKLVTIIVLYILYFFLDMCFCLHLVVHEGKQVTSVGEIHHDDGTKFDRKSHEIWPTHYSTASPRPSTMVRYEPNTLYFHICHFLFQTELKILDKTT
jgi:hypothetical protein